MSYAECCFDETNAFGSTVNKLLALTNTKWQSSDTYDFCVGKRDHLCELTEFICMQMRTYVRRNHCHRLYNFTHTDFVSINNIDSASNSVHDVYLTKQSSKLMSNTEAEQVKSYRKA